MGLLKSSWSGRFVKQYGGLLTIPSLYRYRAAMLRERKEGPRFDDRLSLTLKTPTRASIVMRPASNDYYTFNEVFLDEVYAPVTRYVKRAETIVDLGANIGLASLWFAAKYPGSRLLSIEPDTTNYELLAMNLGTLIQQQRCRALQAALWSTNASVVMNALDSAGHVNQGTVRETCPSELRADVVPGLPMTEIARISGFEQIGLLKVDVEGAETYLFAGERTWLSSVQAIAIEFHANSRNESDFDSVISDAGFKVRESEGHTVVATRE